MIRVIICDDQVIVCEGLKTILEIDPDISVIAVAHDGSEVVNMVSQLEPDLVLMDLKMPVMNGVIATRKIKEKNPDVYILVLTTYDDDEWIIDAIRSGASGYLLKDAPPADLIEAIKGTVSGKSYIDPDVAGKVLSSISQKGHRSTEETHFSLNEREKEILVLLTKGWTNADIAQQLFLSEGTIRNYTSELFKKLGVTDRTQAAVTALRYGLVDFDEL